MKLNLAPGHKYRGCSHTGEKHPTKHWLLKLEINLLLENCSSSSSTPPSPSGLHLPVLHFSSDVVRKEVGGDLHHGMINSHPTSDIAFSQLGLLPFRSSCSLGLAPWNSKFGLSPWSGDPGALCSCQSPAWCSWCPPTPGGGAKSAARGRNYPHLLQVSFQNAPFLLCMYRWQII